MRSVLTNIKFVASVKKICKFFVDLSSNIIRETDDRFCLPDKLDRVL